MHAYSCWLVLLEMEVVAGYYAMALGLMTGFGGWFFSFLVDNPCLCLLYLGILVSWWDEALAA